MKLYRVLPLLCSIKIWIQRFIAAIYAINGLLGSIDHQGGPLQTSSVSVNSLPDYHDYQDAIAEEGTGYPKMDPLDFPKVTRELGIEACEYVNAFFPNRETDKVFIKERYRAF